MSRFLSVVSILVFGLASAVVIQIGLPLLKAISRVDELAAAIMSAPLVGCEPMDIEVRRIYNHREQASWAADCQGKKFVCGRSRSAAGHTLFCNQIGCGQNPEPPEPKKLKV